MADTANLGITKPETNNGSQIALIGTAFDDFDAAIVDADNLSSGTVNISRLPTASRTRTINFVIDGGGSEITDGIKGDIVIDAACTIVSATALADQSGSIVVDIWKDAYGSYPPTDADSITAAAPVTITTAVKSQDATLTGWATSVAAGSILRYNVDSCTTITRATISLKVLV
jgi:hypothetical protein